MDKCGAWTEWFFHDRKNGTKNSVRSRESKGTKEERWYAASGEVQVDREEARKRKFNFMQEQSILVRMKKINEQLGEAK